eukprot:6234164-Pyramimonas_sp.AAC.1
MQEVRADVPTHFSRQQRTASAIGRAFLSIPEHFLLDTDVFLSVDADPLEMSQGRLSDHRVLLLNLEGKAPGNDADHRIPDAVFCDVRYLVILDGLVAAAELDRFPPVARWRHLEDLVIEAAKQTRDESQWLPFRANDKRARGGRNITLR